MEWISKNRNLSFEQDDDILPEARIFESRAANILQAKLEALRALESNKIFEEEKVDETEKEEDLMRKVKEKLKPKPRSRKGKAVPPVPEIEEVTVPTRRSSRRRKAATDVVQVIPEMSVVPESSPQLKLPAVAKRRIKELKLNSSRQQQRIHAENQRILSSCNTRDIEDEPLLDISSERSIMLKIRYMSDISKISVKEEEKFTSIFEKVADLYKLKASEILLCIQDRSIEYSETPLSLNLKYFDIIDCIPYKPLEDMEDEHNPNQILLKLQSNDSRKKIDMYTSKFEKFKDIMEKYSKLRSIPLEKLHFEFDGEKIEGTETPEELDMESGSCIDVKVLTENSKPSIPLVDITVEPIPESEMLQICVLD